MTDEEILETPGQDLTWKTFRITRPVHIQDRRHLDFTGTTIRYVGTEEVPYMLQFDLPKGAQVVGIPQIEPEGGASHFRHRKVKDGVYLHGCNGAVFDGFSVTGVKRYGVVNAQKPGSNIIGARLGNIIGRFCGTPGLTGTPGYTEHRFVVTDVDRAGRDNSPTQRAHLIPDHHLDLEPIEEGDYLVIAGEIVRVMAWYPSHLEVYPWPKHAEGSGEFECQLMKGAALGLFGGNTTQVKVDGIYAQYCGHGAEIASLYGANLSCVMAEVVGSGVTLGAPNATTWGAVINGLHPEIVNTRLMVAGLNVRRCTVISPAVELEQDSNCTYLRQTIRDKSNGLTWRLNILQ